MTEEVPLTGGAVPSRVAGAHTPAAPRRRIGEYVVVAVTIVLGVFVMIDAGTIHVPGSTTVMGPRAFPYLVGGLLLASGVLVLVGLLRGRFGEEDDGEDVDPDASTDWRTVALLGCIFVVHVYTINIAGWPVAATVLFGGSAIVLGARPWWRAIVLGAVLGLVVQILFGGMLGLSLPPGPFLEGVSLFRG
ncbi:tripartite tricarboxylate transporter TctB family protein [Oerskovia douganii]|uniref:tripartite tricarboxylate transporter TctB family protein n=1 Tax=Oerskovia douganii TaxID=2762210 RepID=UPI002AB2ECC6|nr:tripartite tricarboxylate transporter TctB family protein [Oerskovia douganii]